MISHNCRETGRGGSHHRGCVCQTVAMFHQSKTAWRRQTMMTGAESLKTHHRKAKRWPRRLPPLPDGPPLGNISSRQLPRACGCGQPCCWPLANSGFCFPTFLIVYFDHDSPITPFSTSNFQEYTPRHLRGHPAGHRRKTSLSS